MGTYWLRCEAAQYDHSRRHVTKGVLHSSISWLHSVAFCSAAAADVALPWEAVQDRPSSRSHSTSTPNHIPEPQFIAVALHAHTLRGVEGSVVRLGLLLLCVRAGPHAGENV